MKLHFAIFLFLLPATLPVHTAEATWHRPPDILVIYTDDHRADALGCADNPQLRTPNIDRLAERGTTFQSPTSAARIAKNLAAEMHDTGEEKPLSIDRRIPAEVNWSKATQRMDEHQPDWIRKRFSSPETR